MSATAVQRAGAGRTSGERPQQRESNPFRQPNAVWAVASPAWSDLPG
jgi:hypothetical protein